MSRKVSESELNYRSNRPRRRKFCGNQFTASGNTEEAEVKLNETGASTSAKKFKTSVSDVVVNLSFCYKIIEFVSVFSAIADIAICKMCKQKLSFGQTDDRGLGFKIAVKCRCGTTFINSGPFIHNSYEINRRIVFAMRLLGIAREGINIFCGIMDLGKGLSKKSYEGIVRHISASSKKMFDFTCKKAIEEEIKLNEENERPLLSITASGDGSWKKRGFSSLYGVTTLIGHHTGKVIDLVVKSSYCQACIYYKNTDKNDPQYLDHKENCPINHDGSAGKMEVDAIIEMFQRSEKLFGIKYCNYVGDGDTKTFKAILDKQPYGEDYKVTKSECVGHVEKRMGSRLRNIKKTAKLGGKGKLTDALIKKLTKYYGLAIRRNVNFVEDMREAIMATYYHMISTDDEPQHKYCPSVNSWCAYRNAEAQNNLQAFTHPPPLHPDVQKAILPIYKDLCRDDLLERCLGGYTQNANESFNATVWRLAPKHLNCGTKIIEIAAYLAAGMFNEGYTFILQIMNDLELQIGLQCKHFADIYKINRISRQERRSLQCTKEARTARKEEQATLLSEFEEEEGLLYGPGIAD